MKRAVIVIVVFASLLLTVASVQGVPRMELPETEFNFGYAPQNSKVSYVFWIHSTGDDTLLIKKVVPG
ncbi:MAG: DUF1573 domain-containing protein [bacterium]|nr:DUF1573 domain-containing protein [bacterium]